MKAYLSALDLEFNDASVFFALLDWEGSGDIDMETFVNGCLNLKGSAKRFEIARMARKTKEASLDLARLRKLVSKLDARTFAAEKEENLKVATWKEAESKEDEDIELTDGSQSKEMVGLGPDIVYVCKKTLPEVRSLLQRGHEVPLETMVSLLEPETDHDIMVPMEMNGFGRSFKNIGDMIDQLGPTRAAHNLLQGVLANPCCSELSQEITALRLSLREKSGVWIPLEGCVTRGT